MAEFDDLGLSVTPTAKQKQFDLKERDWRLFVLLLLDGIKRFLGIATTPLEGSAANVVVTDSPTVIAAASSKGRKVTIYNHGPANVLIVDGTGTPEYGSPNIGIEMLPADYFEQPVCSTRSLKAVCDATETANLTVHIYAAP